MSEYSLKIAFAGTPELAAIALSRILETNSISVEFVLSQPDRPAGRGRKVKASPVKELALEHALPVYQPNNSAEIDPENLLSSVDLMVVAAYGMLLPEEILNRPKYGCINIHTSLLPRWRGAAPIQRAIEAGDKQTGVTIMQMEVGLDTGPMILKKICDIESDDTAAILHDKLAKLGAEGIIEVLKMYQSERPIAEIQDDNNATYAKKLSKAEAKVDWEQSAEIIERKIRAFNPAPICHSEINGQTMRIWEARIGNVNGATKPGTIIGKIDNGIEIACGNGSLIITRLQLPGKKPITAKQFLNGRPDFI